jgi:hypothetical protein
MCIYHLNKILKKINREKKRIVDIQPAVPNPITRTDIFKPITLAGFVCKIYSLIHVLLLTKIAIKKYANNGDEKIKKLTFLSLKYDQDICKKLQILYAQLELDEDSAEDIAFKMFYYTKLISFSEKIDDAEECKCDEITFKTVNDCQEPTFFCKSNLCLDTIESLIYGDD